MGLAVVQINGKWGFIDKNGNFAIKPVYDGVSPFSEVIALARLNDIEGFIDQRNNEYW